MCVCVCVLALCCVPVGWFNVVFVVSPSASNFEVPASSHMCDVSIDSYKTSVRHRPTIHSTLHLPPSQDATYAHTPPTDNMRTVNAIGMCRYFGATIGRVANRIANGSLTLDGKVYDLPLNDKGVDTLHGGWVGYDRRVWDVTSQTTSSVTFAMTSPDGEEGFPGEVRLTVTHTLTSMGEWELKYAGRSTSTTVLAMTNHAYFNLNANVDDTTTIDKHVSVDTSLVSMHTTAVDHFCLRTLDLLDRIARMVIAVWCFL